MQPRHGIVKILSLIFAPLRVLGDNHTVTTVPEEDGPCITIGLDNVRYQTIHQGTYNLAEGMTCNARVVYRHEEERAGSYMFYKDGGMWRGWMVGTNHCSQQGSMSVEDSALYPQDITGVWREAYRGYWVPSRNVEVTCGRTDSKSTSGRRTLVSTLASLLSIAAMAALCTCACHNCKSSGSRGRLSGSCSFCRCEDDVCRTYCEKFCLCSKLLHRGSIRADDEALGNSRGADVRRQYRRQATTSAAGRPSGTPTGLLTARPSSNTSITAVFVRPPPYEECVLTPDLSGAFEEPSNPLQERSTHSHTDPSNHTRELPGQPPPYEYLQDEDSPGRTRNVVYSVQDERVFSPPPPYQQT